MEKQMESNLGTPKLNNAVSTSGDEVLAVRKGLRVPHPAMAGPLEALAKLKLTEFSQGSTSSVVSQTSSLANNVSPALVHQKFAPSVAAVFDHHEQLGQKPVTAIEPVATAEVDNGHQPISPTTHIKLKQEADLKNILGIQQPPMPRGPTTQIRGPPSISQPIVIGPLSQPVEPQPRGPILQTRGPIIPPREPQPRGPQPRDPLIPLMEPQPRGPHPRGPISQPRGVSIQTGGPIMSTGFSSKPPLLPLPPGINTKLVCSCCNLHEYFRQMFST